LKLAPAIGRIEAPAERRLTAAEQKAERALREVLADDGTLVVALERFLEASRSRSQRTPRPSNIGSSRSVATETRTNETPAEFNRSPTPTRMPTSFVPASVALTIHSPISLLARSSFMSAGCR
jgi:hypothetical protein